MGRENERNGLVMGIEEEQKGVTHYGLSLFVHLLHGVSGEAQAETAGETVAPLVFHHLLAVGT
jgi:hypothetical protein